MLPSPAVRTSIVLEKLAVSLCSMTICVTFMLSSTLDAVAGDWCHHVAHLLVIVLAIVAELATMSYQRIELQKDWFVVVTRGDEAKLASE